MRLLRSDASGAAKIGYLAVTLAFAAFTAFAFLLPEGGMPLMLFS